MARHEVTVSRASGDALKVLGNQIKLARQARGWGLTDTAARLRVDRRTLSAIECGAPGASIGTVFNAAFLVGVNLFGLEGDALARARRHGEDTLALLPSRVRRPGRKDSSDDFDF